MAAFPHADQPSALADRAGRALQVMGALASVALVAAGMVWGYRLLVRDVTGLPVVRAMEGPMRVAPTDPGGEIADHAGLAVNAIAAEGVASETGGVLHIAPATAGLTPEDMEIALSPEAEDAALIDPTPQVIVATETITPDPDGPLTADQIIALADQIAAGVAPLAALESAPSGPAVADILSPDVPGLARVILPQSRPGGLPTTAAPVPVSDAPAPSDIAVADVALTSGTVFVQMGVYDSAESAAADWDRLAGLHGALLAPHNRLIEVAQSNGSPFFRLRAVNFDSLDTARRLCSAIGPDTRDCVFAEAP